MRLFLLIVSILTSISCFSQTKTDSTKVDFAFSPGVILQREVFAEANVVVGRVVMEKMILGISGLRIGGESNLRNGNEFTIAPKVGLEIDATLAAFRLSAANYFQDGNSEFRLIPEIGISWGGTFNLTYGYGFRFQKREIEDLSQHRLSFTVNLNRKLNREAF